MLSEFAGAAKELRQAYMVNPYDLNGMKDVIMQALTDPPAVKRKRMQSMKRQVRENTIDHWAKRFLGDLDTIGRRSHYHGD